MCSPAYCVPLAESGSLTFPAEIDHRRRLAGEPGIGHDLGPARLEETGGCSRANIGKGGKEKSAAAAMGRFFALPRKGFNYPFAVCCNSMPCASGNRNTFAAGNFSSALT